MGTSCFSSIKKKSSDGSSNKKNKHNLNKFPKDFNEKIPIEHSKFNFKRTPSKFLTGREIEISFHEFNQSNLIFNEFIKGDLLSSDGIIDLYTGLSQVTGQLVGIQVVNLDYLTRDSNEKSKFIRKLAEAKNKLISIYHKNLINLVKISNDNIKSQDDNLENIRKISNTFNDDTQNATEKFIFVSEYCDGESIKSLLKRYGEFNEKLIKKYLKEILEGCKYLYNKCGVIHKNLKSSNILVDRNGTIRISDYMINSILLGENKELIERIKILNEIPYSISPDLIKNPELNHFCVDWWSLGCLVIEMATGKNPWSDEYEFKTTSDFLQFLSSPSENYVKPRYPKKLSKSCCAILDLLFIPYDDQEIYSEKSNFEALLKHEFFTEVNSEQKTTPNSKNMKTITSNNSNFNNYRDSSVNLLSKHRKTSSKFINLLKPNEDNEMFTVSVTIQSQTHSIKKNTNQNKNVLSILNDNNSSRISYLDNLEFERHKNTLLKSQNYKKFYVDTKNNIDEELDLTNEYTPTEENYVRQKYFFNEFLFKNEEENENKSLSQAMNDLSDLHGDNRKIFNNNKNKESFYGSLKRYHSLQNTQQKEFNAIRFEIEQSNLKRINHIEYENRNTL